MTYIDLKKVLLVTSVSMVATFGLSACGDDKAAAPAAVEKPADDAATEAPTAMDNATEQAGEMVEEAKEKAKEMVDDAKAKADEAAAKAKQDAIDAAKKKAEEELKKNLP
ncbi:MAG: hypothetical protein L3J58_11525 [Emcibacter sp.]|nr:hypothetical protein [Emcibacter sp.]